MRTALATEHLSVTPGQPVMLEIEVTNTSTVIDGVSASFEGLDAAWVQLLTPVVSLFPEGTGTIVVRLDLPRNCLAGDYLITVHIFSTIDAERVSTQQFWLTVEPVTGTALQVRPSVVTAGSKAEFTALVANTGNVPAQVVVRADEETRAVSCVVDPPTLLVAPGTIERAIVRAKGPRPWFGQSVGRSIAITATTPTEELPVVATFNQKPRIPRGVLTILILAGIIALWATIFLVIVNELRKDDAAEKSVPAHFTQGGATDVPLLAVAGSAAGTVTAESTGEGVARVTVEAVRQTPKGPELIASAATGDDGSYLLSTLLPGTYKLKFTGDGFGERWWPDATSAGAAGEFDIEPTQAVAKLDVVIAGGPGRFVGDVLLPEGAADATITGSVVLVVEEGQPEPEPIPIEIVDGKLTTPGLAAPGTYRFVISSTGFDDFTFEEKLAAGETKVLNTVRLGASLGQISGRTFDRLGRELGGITVTVTSGEFAKEAVTPTDGDVGAYVIDGLETPNTYVVTFSAEGYATVSLTIDLPAGGKPDDVNATLTGGVGTVGGTVRDEDGGVLGGVKVTVVGGRFTAETETLTAGDEGTYVISGLPTPGTFTVTFAADGYDPETRLVRFDSPVEQFGIDIVLHPSTATISGTVSLVGASSSGGVTVELSDGTDVRTTDSATTPDGAYSFTDVAPGTYTLTFTEQDHLTRIYLIRVVAGDVRVVDVSLAAAP